MTKKGKDETTAAPKGKRAISIDLGSGIPERCAELAERTGLPESKIRSLVRAKAEAAAVAAAADVDRIVKDHLDAIFAR